LVDSGYETDGRDAKRILPAQQAGLKQIDYPTSHFTPTTRAA
jgi:hypothetical protein